MTKAVTLELIERIEAAGEPDRELDVLIAEEIGWQGDLVARARTWSPQNTTAVLVADVESDGYLRGLPAYTASVDAALKLLPPGWSWSAGELRGIARYCAFLNDHNTPDGIAVRNLYFEAAGPALALCAAALRARGEAARA